MQGHGLGRISDDDERQTRLMMELTSCLSDATLNWLFSKNFDEKDLKSAEFVLKMNEEKIEKTTNPLVQQVELTMIVVQTISFGLRPNH